MPRVKCDLNNSKYFNYKVTYDESNEVKYFTTKRHLIKEHPELTNRIIYKYVCVNNARDFVPRERRRKKRGYWIEKVKILILRGDTPTIRIPNTPLLPTALVVN